MHFCHLCCCSHLRTMQ